MATSDPLDRAPTGQQPAAPGGRGERARVVAAAIIGGLVAVFAVINLNDVKVHWLFTTTQTPLIIVVVLAFLLGVAGDRLLVIRARRRHRGDTKG